MPEQSTAPPTTADTETCRSRRSLQARPSSQGPVDEGASCVAVAFETTWIAGAVLIALIARARAVRRTATAARAGAARRVLDIARETVVASTTLVGRTHQRCRSCPRGPPGSQLLSRLQSSPVPEQSTALPPPQTPLVHVTTVAHAKPSSQEPVMKAPAVSQLPSRPPGSQVLSSLH